MTTAFTDQEAKTKCQAECDKRNKHKSKFQADKCWKPLWDAQKGWHPEFRHAVEIERRKIGP